jgi:hypothetical protein
MVGRIQDKVLEQNSITRDKKTRQIAIRSNRGHHVDILVI